MSDITKMINDLTEEELLLFKKELEKKGLILNNENQVLKRKNNKSNDIKVIGKKKFHKLSHAQNRLWVMDQYEEESIAYNLPASFIMTGELNIDYFKRALFCLVDRHESLRTVFITENGEPRQKILDNPEYEVELIDVRSSIDPQKEARILADKDFHSSFNLETGPMFRFTVVRIEDEMNLLLFNMHHIISDGWSMNIFIKEFLICYNSFMEGNIPDLKPLRIQYKDYSSWQNNLLVSSEMDNQKEYWLDKLSGELPVLDLPADNIRPVKRSFNGNNIDFVLPEEINSGLNDLCLDNKASLYMMLQALVKVLFYKYTGQEDIILGSPVAGRVHKELENQIGFYVNTLVFRDTIEGNLTFNEFLASVKKTCTDAFDNQDYPFDCLIEELDIKKDPSRSPLFDVLVVLQNNEIAEVEFDGVNLSPYNTEYKISKFDMGFKFYENDKALFCGIEYNTDIYSVDRIKRMAEHLTLLITSVLDNPGSRIKDLEIIPVDEKNLLLNIFNDTKTDYPADKSIVDLFEEQVENTPDNVAVVFEDVELTYIELNEKANIIGHYLRDNYDIKPDDLVGVLLERSEKMIITLLGILKSGAAYVPLDPEFPEERLGYMLEDSEATIIITSKKILKKHSFSCLQEQTKVQVIPTISNTRPQIEDFNNLPIPDRSLVDYEKYSNYIGEARIMNAISIQATRGCPYQCMYCHKIWPKSHIVRSAENIFNEVFLYYNMGVRRFSFIDDIFNLNVKNSIRFFELIIENQLDVQIFFSSGMRGDILTKDYIDLMVKAGVVSLALALESASPRLQKLIKKNINLLKLKENIEYITEKYPQMILELYTMHGFPSETEEEAELTLNFIKSIKWIHFPYVFILKIFPGSEMEELAIEEGVSYEAIKRSSKLAYHEIPETLPFKKDFTLKYQANFLNEYFLNKQRLLSVLPYQIKVFTEDELVQKYNSYLPVEIKSIKDLLKLADIDEDELSDKKFLPQNTFYIKDFNKKLKSHFPQNRPAGNALKILFLDLSQLFQTESIGKVLSNLVEPPLGLMYLLTYLNKKQGYKINGKIAKSMIDFADYNELKALLVDFKPDVICIRTLSFYKDFFHEAISKMRLWGIDVPVITGGPYATSSYESVLQDRNIDIAVLGEGEITLNELISRIIENEGRLPAENILSTIKGIAYIPDNKKRSMMMSREVLLEEDLSQFAAQKSNFNLPSINNSNDLAYAIYTSGSTGIPKGTLIEHESVIRLVRDTNYINIEESDIILQLSNYAFDGSVFDIYGSLLNGAKLVLIGKDDIADINKLSNIISLNNVSVFFVTTALFNILVDSNLECLINVRKILFGGEQCSSGHIKKAVDYLGSQKIIHVYGPTESTVYSTYFEINQIVNDITKTYPIGSPISNTTAYIIDKDKNTTPVGVPGELCLSGVGLSRGYLNRPELTAEKFVDNPFDPGQRMYRTGDLAQWLPDGNIEFLGRIDNQVKIRGFRIEIGEIENSLVQHNGINSAVVVAKDGIDGDRQLVAYYISDSELEVSDIRSFLKFYLPDYMIPSYFIYIDSFPLISNGKIDRKALPEPDGSINTGVEYIAPRDDIETKLVEIWQEVLCVEKIGVHDNFFELGGHSLKATRVGLKISREFKVCISLKDVFENPTVEDLSGVINSSAQSEYKKIEVITKQDTYELSNAQRRLWVLDQYEEESIAYNMPFAFIVKGELDIESFNQAFTFMIERHESLRTVFVAENGEPRQKILTGSESRIEIIDLKGNPDGEQEAQSFAEREIMTPFNLETGLLIRFSIIQIEDDKNLLLFNMHHIISDGWSMNIFIREFLSCYNSFRDGNTPNLKPLRIHYKDYSTWQNDLLVSDEIKCQNEYWLEKLSGELPVLDLPSDKVRPASQTFNGSCNVFSFSKDIVTALNNLCRENNISLFMMLQALVKVLFHRYTGQTDIILGSPVAGRVHEDLEGQIGFYVNTLIIRDTIECDLSFREVLNSVGRTCTEAFENQIYPFDRIVEDLDIKRDLSRSPLFDVMLELQNNESSSVVFEGLELIPYKNDNVISKYDMTFSFSEGEEELYCSIEYNTDIYSEERMERMGEHLRTLTSSVIENPETKVKDLEIIPVVEKNLLLNIFNNKEIDFPRDKTIVDLFEEQVEKTPDNTAVVFEDIELTYKELNERANIVAHSLLDDYSIEPDDLVGIVMDRSEKLLISILGVFKAGGAYIPVDPGNPAERKRHILEDSNLKVIIGEEKSSDFIDKELENIYIDIDQILETNINTLNPVNKSKPENLAYVIYTSGSTGKPKGAMVEHIGMMNHICSKIDVLNVTSRSKIAQNASQCFDISVWQLLTALLRGGTTYIYNNDLILNPDKFIKEVIKHKITILEVVPTFLSMLLEFFEKSDILENLEYCLVTGEEVKKDLVKQWFDYFPDKKLVNAYGPTEASDDITHYVMDRVPENSIIPIGKPVQNFNIYIIDKNFKICPIGINGEIVVSGTGVGRGYVNNSERTALSFFNDPFIENENVRLYKTGDIGRWLPDGNIEFLGRIDNQVKIRGFRIELGEIENALLQLNNINLVVVHAKEGNSGEKYLIAYFTSDKEIEVEVLRNPLSKLLPNYMIPSYFTQLSEMPLTPNGKIDRKVLPDLDGSINAGVEYVAPCNEIQDKLAEIWKDILGIERIGIYDNFFNLGGHSLKATRVITRINNEFGANVSLKEIFTNPTIEWLSQRIEISLDQESENKIIIADNDRIEVII